MENCGPFGAIIKQAALISNVFQKVLEDMVLSFKNCVTMWCRGKIILFNQLLKSPQ